MKNKSDTSNLICGNWDELIRLKQFRNVGSKTNMNGSLVVTLKQRSNETFEDTSLPLHYCLRRQVPPDKTYNLMFVFFIFFEEFDKGSYFDSLCRSEDTCRCHVHIFPWTKRIPETTAHLGAPVCCSNVHSKQEEWQRSVANNEMRKCTFIPTIKWARQKKDKWVGGKWTVSPNSVQSLNL